MGEFLKKFGMNQYRVIVVDYGGVTTKEYRCAWLGHYRFQCGKCKKGYFNVTQSGPEPVHCPECKTYITVREADD